MVLAASFGLAFVAAIFQDFLLFGILVVLLALFFGEFLRIEILSSRPGKRFQVSWVEATRRTPLLFPGELSSEEFLLETKGSGSVYLSSGMEFLKFYPESVLISGRSSAIRVEFQTPFAGEYVFNNLKLDLEDPLRFFSNSTEIPVPPMEFRVFPRVLQIAGDSTKLLGKSGIGETPINVPGIGTEFYDIREYSPGDDFRQINWKASARRGGLLVNEKMKEVGGSYMVVLEAKAQDYFEKDRLASAFLNIANSLTIMGVRFGVIVYDGNRIIGSHRETASPESSLAFCLKESLVFADLKPSELMAKELSAIGGAVMKSNERFLDNLGMEVLSQIENSGRINLQRYTREASPFREIQSILKDHPSDTPVIIFVSGLYGAIDPIVELATQTRRAFNSEFTVVNPTMPWVVAPDEATALKEYEKFQRLSNAFRASHIEYFVGDPKVIASRLFAL
jgi:uncharacterized protein (DUF58 family)